MRKLLMVLAFGAVLAAGPALAQVVPTVPKTGNDTIDAAGQQVNDAVQNAPTTAQGVANSIVPGSGDAAKAIVDIARSADPIDAVVGAVLGGLESKLLEVVLEHGKLKERVTTLEADNTKRAIDVQHSRAIIDQQVSQIAALNQQVQSMQAELAAALGAMEQQTVALRARVAELERTKGTITAPFKVIDGSGFPLLLIDTKAAIFSSPGGGKAAIGLSDGPPFIVLENSDGAVNIEGGAKPRLAMAIDGTSLLLSTDGDGATIVGTSADSEFQLATGSDLTGLMINKDGEPAAGLSSYEGRAIALRVFAAGSGVVAAMGTNPNVPGTGIAYVGNGSQNAAALAVAQDGSGIVHAFAADGTVGSGLIGGPRMVAAYNAAGNAVVTIGQSENSEGGNVTARDPSGDGVFRAGYNSAVTGGDACVYRAKRQNVYCLGIGAPGMGIGTF